MIKIKDLKPFDMAEMLDTEEDIKNSCNPSASSSAI